MTNAQVTALQYGLIGFFALWATVLIPQLIVLHSRGRVRLRPVLTMAAVLLYATMTLAVTFLPLPGPGVKRPSQTVQLHPFQWITDIHTELLKHGLPMADWFTTQTFQQATMNVLLFVPLGFFARTLWKRGLIGTTLIGLAASLLIEITQLTANFGTAPHVYRIFDVDDLLNNTGGAMLGWIAGALLLSLVRKPVPSTVELQPDVLATAEGSLTQPVRSERIDLAQVR
ncbi:VanZ family protein [Amycolatopsis sp. BJA-103]|uniref:VanZ family protein n=1 Tax=unclassified Amycolatopsis TaxID=2618356 RepID=UPI000C765CA3|nr:VanZ family protein [Amycolatopsis sp. BJA-103]AUI62511.1 VanZ family protein [Amycolatopsis sp. BJA-103]PNE18348.1 VanZ family protein [Amycolatopsis sp. BJA-103]